MVTRKEVLAGEYNPYYEDYLREIHPDATIPGILQTSLQESIDFIDSVDKDLSYSYENDKWSIGQVIQHCIDTERIFAYRALRFLRGDATALVGFDQDLFTKDFEDYAFAKASLITSLKTTREFTMQVYNETPSIFHSRSGIANNNAMTARAIPFIIVGHTRHHEKIVRERYL